MATIKKKAKVTLTLSLSKEEALAVGAALRGFEEAREAIVRESNGSAVRLKKQYSELLASIGLDIGKQFSYDDGESIWAYQPESTTP